MTDWKEKEKAALEEGHHWAIQAGLQFDKTWTKIGGLYRQFEFVERGHEDL